MRVLLPIHQAHASGGIGTVARELPSALRPLLTADEELIVVPAPGELPPGATGLGAPGAIARLRYEQLGLPRQARDVDLIHLCDARPVLASRTPFLITVPDVTYLDFPAWFSRPARAYKRAMLALGIAKGPAAILCYSDYTRRRLLAHHPRAGRLPVRVVHPGVSSPPSGEVPAAAEEEEGPYLLTVATVEPRKNHLTMIDALRRARARGVDLRWKVAGECGPGGADIRSALAAEPGVEVLGRVSPAKLEALYAGAHFLVAPSHAEGFGFPPLEAMLRGVPVICSRGSAFDETVGDAALQVDPCDVEGWADALCALALDGAERDRLRALGRPRAEAFHWSHSAAAFLDCYRSLARPTSF